MIRPKNPNIHILELAAAQLGELTGQLVFLGGCATGLLITDPAAPPIRMTKDVDALVQVFTLSEFRTIEAALRDCGFREDMSPDAPICRWQSTDVILDIMPSDEKILGFGSQWYKPASENAIQVMLPSGVHIRMVSAPYFLITKLEAFAGRGQGDFLMSHDIEDIVAVMDGRPELVTEMTQTTPELQRVLSQHFQDLLKNRRFLEALAGHLPAETGSAGVKKVLAMMQHIAQHPHHQ